MDLAFEDAELVAKGENLDLKCGFGLPAKDKVIEQRAEDGERRPRIMGRDHGDWVRADVGPRAVDAIIGRPITR